MIGSKSKVSIHVILFFGFIKHSQENDQASQIPSMNAWHIGGWSAIRTQNWSRVRERGVKKPLKSNLTRRGGCVGPLWSHKFARGCAIAGATGVIRHPIGRCALAARSCISTLANHSFRLIVGKSAALRARCHAAQNAYSPSLSLSLSRAMEFLGIGCEEKGQCPWIFIVPAGSNSAPTNALSASRTNWRENAVITAQPSRESKKTEIVIKSCSEKIMHREKANEREKDK